MSCEILIRKFRSLIELSEAEALGLRSLSTDRVHVPHHRDLLRAMQAPEYLYIILSGWAARYSLRSDGTRRITGFMLSGDMCGIHAVAGAAMDHSIVAITDCEVGKVPVAEVQALVARTPTIGKALWRAKLVDEAILRQWLLSSADTMQALARLLCELNARAEAAGLCEAGSCDLPLTQEQIGDALGRTGVHVNRTLQKLRSYGYVEFAHGRLKIANSGELQAIAQWNARYLTPWSTA